MNKNYEKGVRKERKLVNEARALGMLSFRSAGSHSPIDLVIIDKESRIIKFIQCKPDSLPISKKVKLENELKWLNDIWVCKFEVL